MTLLDASLCFVWLSCMVIGYTQVSAEGKEKQTALKEDLKRSFFFFPPFFFSWGFCALMYAFVVGEIVWNGLGLFKLMRFV